MRTNLFGLLIYFTVAVGIPIACITELPWWLHMLCFVWVYILLVRMSYYTAVRDETAKHY